MLTSEDKRWLESECGKIKRVGLYVIALFSMLSSCSVEYKIAIQTGILVRLESEISELKTEITTLQRQRCLIDVSED